MSDGGLHNRSTSGTFPPVIGERDDWAQIGARLRLVRLAMELNQPMIAERLGAGVTMQSWNNWERGRNEIPRRVAVKLCLLSGVDLDFIYRGEMGALSPSLAARIQAHIGRPPKRIRTPRVR